MNQDDPVTQPENEPGVPRHLLTGRKADETLRPEGDPADVRDQRLAPPGSDEEEALDLLAERTARSDDDRPA